MQPMTKETLAALEGSIRKWEAIVKREGTDEAGTNCPLCHLFQDCSRCLIYEDTGYSTCRETPYTEWCSHQEKFHDGCFPYFVTCSRCAELAQAEVDYLKGLLP